jgi:hypothetical protein
MNLRFEGETMNDTKQVCAALVAAQRNFAPALKTATNPHFKSRYADLSACVEAVIDALNAAGIALVQKQHPSDGGVAVETVFVHESGECLSAGILQVPAVKSDPQGYGSALTYARRYSLMAACGIAPEDDDGNAAKTKQERGQSPDQSHDQLGMFPAPVQAKIRKAASAALQAFSEGHEWSAYEEASSLWNQYPEGDERNQIKLALANIFKPHSALRASLKKMADQERANQKEPA